MRSPDKRLLLLCQHFYPEMVSTGLLMTELSEGLSKRRIDISVYAAPTVYDLSNKNIDTPQEMSYNGISIKRSNAVGNHNGSLLSRLIFAFSYLISTILYVFRQRKKFDGMLVGTNPPFLGIVCLLFKKFFGDKYMLIVHDVYPDYAISLGVIKEGSILSRIWDSFTKGILKNADAIVVLGRDMKNLIVSKVDGKAEYKVHVIPNWSNEERMNVDSSKENEYRDQFNLNGKFLIVYSGTMNKSHNLEPLLEAASKLKEENFAFLFVGDGSNRENLERMADELDLNNTYFLPFQPIDKLPEVLASCDISVVCLEKKWTGISVPSKTYGIMASGKAILAFMQEESEIGMTIEENECGIVVEDPSPDEISVLLKKLAKDKNLVQQMGRNSYRAFEEKYNLQKAINSYYQVIEEVF